MFDWDRSNLRKIRAHRISREEAEQALVNDAIPIYEQHVDGERRFITTAKPARGACWHSL